MTLGMTDELFDIIKKFDPALELKYNEFYIGLAKNGLVIGAESGATSASGQVHPGCRTQASGVPG
jgi:hypothetical protein